MPGKTYYIVKVKGKAKIPDYVQVRDADFTLVGYYRPGRGEKIANLELSNQIESLAEHIPVGVVTRITLQ